MNPGYAIALIVAAMTAAGVAVISWRKRTAPGGTSLCIAMSAMAVWAGTYAVHWMVDSPEAARFWLDATYFGVVVVPTAFLAFTLEFTGRTDLMTRRNLSLMSIIPAATLVVLWTDSYHALFYGGQRGDGTILTGGVGFWVFVSYSYLLLVIALGLLLQTALHAPTIYRRQAWVMIAGLLLPWVGNLVGIADASPVPDLDLTPFVFVASGCLFAFGLFRLGLLDVVPVARNRLVESMSDGVLVLDSQFRVVDVNPAARLLTAIGPEQLGMVVTDTAGPWRDLLDRPAAHNTVETTFPHAAGRHVEIRMTPLDTGTGASAFLITVRDITQRKATENELARYRARLERASITDDLTGIANRRRGLQRLEEEYARFQRTGTPLSVIMLDLDDFKHINDTMGHAAGDVALAETAGRIRSVTRNYDVVCRIGGEEFMVVAPSTDSAQAHQLAERIRGAVASGPVVRSGREIPITASLGIATAVAEDPGADSVMHRADGALYTAKGAGKNRVHPDATEPKASAPGVA